MIDLSRWKRLRLRLGLMMLVLAAFMLSAVMAPQSAYAHASVVQATPEADSKFQESPPEVKITFNERLDDGLFYIKVFDHTGREAAHNQAQMSSDHTAVQLALPKLREGVYLISYHVISADGHPVGGSYPITIGNPPQEDRLNLPVTSSHQHGGSGPVTTKDMLQYASRGLWYLAVLVLAGWVIWLRLPAQGGLEARQAVGSWTLNLQRVHFITLLLLIFTHVEDLLGDGGVQDLWRLFSATSVGVSWLLLLVISLIGFAVVGRWAWLDIVFAVALLAAKSFSGHAASFEPQWATIGLDFIHLAAAALWVGGLVLLAVKWRHQSQALSSYLRAFSNMAFLSIIVLTVTGVISVLLFLPNLRYLLYSSWGTLLFVKIGLVLLVAIVGMIIRLYLRKQQEQRAKLWFKMDLILMIVIVGVVGILTYVAPIPSNQPLNWHQMGEKVHVSADITPKVQGTNTFVAKVWLPEQSGSPKQVQMILHYQDDASIAPISVPIVPFDDKTMEDSYGLKKYSYKVSGAYLPFRGNWDLEMRVMDKDDNETVYHKTFIVY